jgi:hypothetical protein
MQPRIIQSEPDQAFRQPPTAWQRDRMGRLRPQCETLPISRREERATYAVVLLMVLSIVVFGVVL